MIPSEEGAETCWVALSIFPNRTCIQRTNKCQVADVSQSEQCDLCNRGVKLCFMMLWLLWHN